MNEDLVRVAPPDARRPARAAAGERLVLPRLIVDAGPVAVARLLEFFAARIANRRTRAAYGRAVGQFLAWCAARGLGLTAVSPLHVAAYIRTHPGSAPTVKQHLAAIRMLGDWLVVSQVLPVNPAAAVRGPTHVVTTGATPVLSPAEARRLLAAIDTGHARRPARPGARLGDALQRRAGERGHRHAAAGLLPAGAPGVAQAPREGRHAARRPGPTIGRPRRSTTTSRWPGSTRRRRRSSRASTRRGGG